MSEEVFFDPAQSRPAAVEAAIAQFDGLSESDRLRHLCELPCEALVYFLRRMHGARELHNALASELTSRVLAMARPWLRRLGKEQKQEILEELASDIAVLALTVPAAGKPDGLEITFGKVLHCRTIDKYRKLAWTKSRQTPITAENDRDDEADERQIPILEHPGKGPEKAVIEKVLIEKGLNQIQDPIRREIFRKHHLEGFPVTSKDPKESTIVREFGIPVRTAMRWLKEEFEAIRRAIAGGKQ